MTAPDPGSTASDQRNATVTLNSNVAGYVAGMDQSTAATNRTADAVDRLDAKLAALQGRVSRGLVKVSRDDFAGLAVGAGLATQFDAQLGTLNATAKITGQSFAGIKGAISSTFTSLPASRTEVIQLIQTLTELGVSGSKNLASLATTFIKLGEATGENANGLAQSMLQLQRLTGEMDPQKVAGFANSLLTVSKNAGVSATGVLNFATSIAPMARQAGIGEAAILGISAAFSKAGSDGFVASNAFNGIIGDITKLTASGSPELAKYANLIGVTVNQLKGMNKATAFTDVLSQLTKQGPQAINILNRLGFDGVRTVASLTALSQSGDLNNLISQSVGSSGNTKNLDKGSAAARSNLVDSLKEIRNQMTQMGTEIGETFEKPMKIAADAVLGFLHALGPVVHVLSPIIAMMATFAGAIAGVAGGIAALGHVVGMGAIAALLIRSGPVRALRDGITMGRGPEGTVTATGAQIASGGRGVGRLRLPFAMGAGLGRVMGPAEEGAAEGRMGPGFLRMAAHGAIMMPGMAVSGLARSQSRMYADATAKTYDRSAYSRGSSAFAVSGTGEATVIAQETAARTGAIASMKAWGASTAASIKTSAEERSVIGALGSAAMDATKALVGLGVRTARTAVGLPGALMRSGAGGVAEEGAAVSRFAGVRGAVGAVGGGVARAGRSLFSGLGGPLGLGLTAAMFAPEIMSMFHNNGPANAASDLNPITKYNEALGTTAGNLATFNTAVTAAKSSLTDLAKGQSLTDVAKVTGADKAAVSGGYKITDPNIGHIHGTNRQKVQGGIAYLQQLGITNGGMDSQTLQLAKQDLIKQFGPEVAGQILSGYTSANPSGAATGQFNGGALGVTSRTLGNKDYGSITGSVLSGVKARAQKGPSAQSNAAALQQLLQFGGESLGGATNKGATGANYSTFIGALQKLTGAKIGSNQSYDTQVTNVRGNKLLSGPELEKELLKEVGASSAGRQYLAGLGVSSKDLLGNKAIDFTTKIDSAQSNAISGSGALGRFAEGSSVVQGAINNPDDPGKNYAATQALYNKAGGMGASTDKLAAQFDVLTGKIKDTTDPLYQLARSAKAYAQQQEQYAMPYQSRAGQLATTARDYTEAATAQATSPTTDTPGDLQTAQASYQSQQQSAQQYEVQLLQQARAYGVQMERANEDYHLTVSRSNRDFYISQEQAQEDYQRSTYRSLRDHNNQLAEQNAQQSQSVFGGPTQRVQGVFTVDAVDIEQNLADQNQRLRRQKAELDALKKMGLSDDAIQQLNLDSTDMGQQVDALLIDAKRDPSVIGNLNAQTVRRVKLTKSLQQNDYNLQFAQGNADFTRGLRDAAQDYDTARQRAVDSQQRALGDMAKDFSTQQKRSAQDLTTSMTEIYGTFADNYGKTIGAINKDIGKYAPDIAKTLITELSSMKSNILAAGALASTPLDPTVYASLFGGTTTTTTPHTQSSGGGKTPRAIASGGIAVGEHYTSIAEGNQPEVVIPLASAKGDAYTARLAGSITMAMVKQMGTRNHPGMPSGGGGTSIGTQTVKIDQGTHITGPITVHASTLKEITDSMLAKARLSKLTAPQVSTPTSS